jgi:rod shape-determining protein MreD
MRKKIALFLYSLFTAFFCTLLFPSIRLFVFAPFLCIAIQSTPLTGALWWAACSGLLLDLLSADFPLGFHALILVGTTALLYPRGKYFIEDKLASLALFSTLFSAIATIFNLALLFFFEKKIPLSWNGIFSDILLMPFIDGLYAFVWFTLPLKGIERCKKRRISLEEEESNL